MSDLVFHICLVFRKKASRVRIMVAFFELSLFIEKRATRAAYIAATCCCSHVILAASLERIMYGIECGGEINFSKGRGREPLVEASAGRIGHEALLGRFKPQPDAKKETSRNIKARKSASGAVG